MIAVIVLGGLAALFLKETGAAALKSAPAKRNVRKSAATSTRSRYGVDSS